MIRLLSVNAARHRSHPFRALASVMAVAAGSALIVAVLAIYSSMTASIQRVTALGGDADLAVTASADSGFDESLVAKLAAIPGTEAVLPVARSHVQLDGRQVLVLGFDGHVLQFGGAVRRAADAVIAQHAAGPGLLVGRALSARPRPVTAYAPGSTMKAVSVLGRLPGSAAALNDGLVAAGPLPLVQALAGKAHRVDVVYLRAAGHADIAALGRSAAAVVGGRASVASATAEVDQSRSATAPVRQAMLLGAAMALVVACFVVFNIMSMAAVERRQELGTLRAMGGPRRTLFGLLVADMALLGLAGGLVGGLAGLATAKVLVGRLPTFVIAHVGVGVGFSAPWWLPLLGAACGAVTAVAGAAAPAWRAVCVPPVAALDSAFADAPSGRAVWPYAIAGAALGGLALAGTLVAPGHGAVVAVAGLVAGGALITYALARPIAGLAAGVARRMGGAGQLAAASIEHGPARAWAAAVAVTACVAVVVAMAGGMADTTSSVDAVLRPLADTALYVETSPGQDVLTATRLPDTWGARLASLPGVTTVGAGTLLFALHHGDRVVVEGAEGVENSPALRLAPPAARDAVLAGRGVIVSTQFAKRFHARVGSNLTLDTPSGRHTLPVAGTVESIISPRGLVALAGPLLRSWYGESGVSWYELGVQRGARRADVEQAVRAMAGSTPFPLYVRTGAQHVRAARGAVAQVTAAFAAIQLVVVLAAALAVLTTLFISMVERRRELGILRAMGTSRRRLQQASVREALALGLVGAVVGVPLGALLHRTMVASIAAASGLPIHPTIELASVAAACVAAAVVSVLGAALPAWRVARLNVLEAIGYE